MDGECTNCGEIGNWCKCPTAGEEKCIIAQKLLQEWVNKQGHDRCWYYPEIFKKLCELFDVKLTIDPSLPPKNEFEEGCRKYQEEEYGEQNLESSR